MTELEEYKHRITEECYFAAISREDSYETEMLAYLIREDEQGLYYLKEDLNRYWLWELLE